jgi:hypothetical protein
MKQMRRRGKKGEKNADIFKKKALDRTIWRARIGRGNGLAVSQMCNKDACKKPTDKFNCYTGTPDLYSRAAASNFHQVRPTFTFLEKFSGYGQIGHNIFKRVEILYFRTLVLTCKHIFQSYSTTRNVCR